MDLTNLDTAQDINVQLMKIFNNIQTNLDNNNPLISEEVQDYMQLGGVVKEYFAQVATFRKKKNY